MNINLNDPLLFSKAMQIPGIELGKVTEILDEENGMVSIFLGADTALRPNGVEEFAERCNKYLDWEPHYPYDFRNGTTIQSKTWRVEEFYLSGYDAFRVNKYTNTDCTPNNRLVSDGTKPYECAYWFCAKKRTDRLPIDDEQPE